MICFCKLWNPTPWLYIHNTLELTIGFSELDPNFPIPEQCKTIILPLPSPDDRGHMSFYWNLMRSVYVCYTELTSYLVGVRPIPNNNKLQSNVLQKAVMMNICLFMAVLITHDSQRGGKHDWKLWTTRGRQTWLENYDHALKVWSVIELAFW